MNKFVATLLDVVDSSHLDVVLLDVVLLDVLSLRLEDSCFFGCLAGVFSLLFMLSVSSNVKGLGCPQKRSRVRDFLKLYYIDVVLLQETKTVFPSDSFLRSIGDSFITD